MIELNHGLRLIGTDLWLDSKRSRPLGFISHAHGDHTGRHRRVVATPTTWRLCRHRLSSRAESIPVDYHQDYDLDGLTIRLYPSGHMLGAAQIMIQNGERVVYTGDMKLAPNFTTAGAEIVPCDTLIIECTFGKPQYQFPPLEESARRVVEFVERAFEDAKVPVLLAYMMGKSQEALKLLGRHGYTACLSRDVLRVVRLYEDCGVTFGRYEPLGHGDNLHGKVVIVPPHAARMRLMARIPNRRTAVLTGWALEPGAAARYGADEAIAWSDHADFTELCRYVRQARPSRVYTVHGPPDFARYLCREGIRAEHLAPGVQLGLW